MEASFDASIKASQYASRSGQRRTARARREQRARAAARTISRIVHASVSLAVHRGCQPGTHLAGLADLLVERPHGFNTSEPPCAPTKVRPSALSRPRKPPSPISSATLIEEIGQEVVVESAPQEAGQVRKIVQQFEGALQKPQPQTWKSHRGGADCEDYYVSQIAAMPLLPAGFVLASVLEEDEDVPPEAFTLPYSVSQGEEDEELMEVEDEVPPEAPCCFFGRV